VISGGRRVEKFRSLEEVAVEGALKAVSLARLIRPYSRRLVFRKGEYVFLPGDPGDEVYLIIKGKVRLSYPGQGGQGLTLSVLRDGELFGELALVGLERRELAAEVLERSSIWAIEKEGFLRLLRASAGLSLQMMELFLRRLKLLEERLMELLYQDPLLRLSFLAQTGPEELKGVELIQLIRVAMAEGAIATPPSSCHLT